MTNNICDEIKELVNERLSEIDDVLINIIHHIEIGDYSDSLIIYELEELRKKVW